MFGLSRQILGAAGVLIVAVDLGMMARGTRQS
jgi:hypothetical protein